MPAPAAQSDRLGQAASKNSTDVIPYSSFSAENYLLRISKAPTIPAGKQRG